MFSITLKRSAATLGVVAGLLVAAAPANAEARGTQVGSEGVKAPAKAEDQMKVTGIKAVVVLIGANDYGFADPSSSRSRE